MLNVLGVCRSLPLMDTILFYLTGLNCLHIAAQFGFTSIVAYLVTHPRFAIVSLIMFIFHNGIEILSLLLLSQDINCTDGEGRTPLMLASLRSYRYSIMILFCDHCHEYAPFLVN